MKRFLTVALVALLLVTNGMAQHVISGCVTDGRQPLIGANVFVVGTIDGAVTDMDGRFRFQTTCEGEVTVRVSYVGYDDFTHTGDVDGMDALNVTLRERAATIDEVVVTASSFSFGKSDNFKTMDALDVVLSGNSCGDVVAALQSLPGTQRVGEDGRLYVRGGDSGECQTFINGMHVLMPYGTNVGNTVVRGRFSPFLFKGINFSLGGYQGEYGQALSSVLPMETTDAATSDKLGVSLSPLEWNAGGTKAWRRSALSFNADYLDMGLYNKVFPDRYDWAEPYRKLSGETQYKHDFHTSAHLKSYLGYDYTTLAQHLDDRRLGLKEHNGYFNTTFRTETSRHWTLFAGLANSMVLNLVDEALTTGDRYRNFRNEIHLKGFARKSFSKALRTTFGMENYLRNTRFKYSSNASDNSFYHLDYQLMALFTDVHCRLTGKWFLNTSMRGEYTGYDKRLTVMPRATLSFVPSKHLQVSLMAGRYSQVATDDHVAWSGHRLGQSMADHVIVSVQYNAKGTLVRVEPYFKRYWRLPLLEDGTYVNEGFGKSRGVDFYAETTALLPGLAATFSYSYNDSKRRSLSDPVEDVPSYATRHNLCVTAKYFISQWKIYVGMSDTYASGRPYHNPHLGGWMNGRTAPYNSLDMNLTFLLSPKVILYTSLNNVLGRKNVFGYQYAADGVGRMPVVASRDSLFYIGIFISLKNNKAYDISNF